MSPVKREVIAILAGAVLGSALFMLIMIPFTMFLGDLKSAHMWFGKIAWGALYVWLLTRKKWWGYVIVLGLWLYQFARFYPVMMKVHAFSEPVQDTLYVSWHVWLGLACWVMFLLIQRLLRGQAGSPA